MNKLAIAFVALALSAAAPGAWADDSGHTGVNSLKSQMRQMHRQNLSMGAGVSGGNWIRCRAPQGEVRWAHRCS
jgi:hypothetical protein